MHIELSSDADRLPLDDAGWDWTHSVMCCGLVLWVQDDGSLRPGGHDFVGLGSMEKADCRHCLDLVASRARKKDKASA